METLKSGKAGKILRAKGFCPAAQKGSNGEALRIHFDFLPGSHNVELVGKPNRYGVAVIGQDLNEKILEECFS